MKALALTVAAGGVLAGLVIPAVSAQAAPPASGASVVLQQNGVTTNRLCSTEDVVFAASGFAPNRGSVTARIEVIGGGTLFSDNIPLTDGSGTYDTGQPGHGFDGAKVRVRYQTGSTGHISNVGSFSATIVNCDAP